jgi:hypothetical protein
VRANFDHLFPELPEHRCPSPEAFCRRENVSPAQRAALRAALDDIENNRTADSDIYKVTMFVKLENGEPIQDNCFEDKAPRGVASSTAHYNVLVGPTIAEATRQLKESWSTDHFITYAPGHDAVELGAFADEIDEQLSECDYSRFESSRHTHTHAMVRSILHGFGADDWLAADGRRATHHMKAGEAMRGRSAHGILYFIEDVLSSGRPDTSFGNSVINGLSKVSAFCYASSSDFQPTEYVFGARRHVPFPDFTIGAALVEDAEPGLPKYGDTFGPPAPDGRYDKDGYAAAVAWIALAIEAGARPSFGTNRFVDYRFKSLVAGDDHAATHKRVNLEFVDEWDTSLGFATKRAHRANVDELTFCSAHFVPAHVNGRATHVLAPDWKRVVSRLGWVVNPAFNVHNPKVRLGVMRGNALSLYNVSRAVPMLRVYVDRLLQLTAGAQPRSPGYTPLERMQVTTATNICFDSASYARYGLGPADEQAFADRLAQVPSLPGYAYMPWISLSLFSFSFWAVYVAPLTEEALREIQPWFYLVEVFAKLIDGQYIGAIISLLLHTSLARVVKIGHRILVHLLWNASAMRTSRIGVVIAAMILIGVQPSDAACSTAHVARAFEFSSDASQL